MPKAHQRYQRNNMGSHNDNPQTDADPINRDADFKVRGGSGNYAMHNERRSRVGWSGESLVAVV